MANRVNGFVVVLGEGIHAEHAEAVQKAILQLRHVVEGRPLPVNLSRDFAVRTQTLREVQEGLNEVMRKARGT